MSAHLKTFLSFSLAFFFAIMAGVVASRGQAIPVILFMGSLVSLALMFQPVTLLWIVTLTTLIIAGSLAYMLPSLNKISWIGYILASILSIPSLLHGLILKPIEKCQQSSSQIVYPFLIFVVICCLSTVINSAPIWPAILVVKSIFMYGGVWVALALLNLSSTVIQHWLMALVGIGMIQIIPALYQYVFVRSARIQVGLGDVTASDSVVGTFGGTMDAGGLSAVLAIYLVILILCIFAFRRSNLVTPHNLFWTIGLLIFPLLLAEVKIIFVYFPLAFIFLYKDVLKKRPIFFITSSIWVTLIILIMLVAYQMFHWSARSGGSFIGNVTHHFSYSFNEKFRSDSRALQGRMSRRQVLEFWWKNHNMDEPLPMLIGHGLGASRTQGLGIGYIAKQYYPMAIDHTSLALLLWDVGLIGTLAFLSWLLFAFIVAGQLGHSQNLEPWQSALAMGLQAALIPIAISLIYRNDIPYAAPMMFILMAILGLLDWLYKQQRTYVS